MLEAGELVWENCRQKIFRFHALQWRGEFRSATETRDGQRSGRVPAPANSEHRRIEQSLNEQVANRFGIQITKNLLQRKRVLRAERNHNRVIGRRCLQLEIERTTKTFSQCETPRPIDSAAERRVQNQLHPA